MGNPKHRGRVPDRAQRLRSCSHGHVSSQSSTSSVPRATRARAVNAARASVKLRMRNHVPARRLEPGNTLTCRIGTCVGDAAIVAAGRIALRESRREHQRARRNWLRKHGIDPLGRADTRRTTRIRCSRRLRRPRVANDAAWLSNSQKRNWTRKRMRLRARLSDSYVYRPPASGPAVHAAHVAA